MERKRKKELELQEMQRSVVVNPATITEITYDQIEIDETELNQLINEVSSEDETDQELPRSQPELAQGWD